jgi:hypothetical protein
MLERRELQSILRVTAYAFGKKGLSIGMVNRKVFAEIGKYHEKLLQGVDGVAFC